MLFKVSVTDRWSAPQVASLTVQDKQMLDHKWLKNMSAGGWKHQTSECKGGEYLG